MELFERKFEFIEKLLHENTSKISNMYSKEDVNKIQKKKADLQKITEIEHKLTDKINIK